MLARLALEGIPHKFEAQNLEAVPGLLDDFYVMGWIFVVEIFVGHRYHK